MRTWKPGQKTDLNCFYIWGQQPLRVEPSSCWGRGGSSCRNNNRPIWKLANNAPKIYLYIDSWRKCLTLLLSPHPPPPPVSLYLETPIKPRENKRNNLSSKPLCNVFIRAQKISKKDKCGCPINNDEYAQTTGDQLTRINHEKYQDDESELKPMRNGGIQPLDPALNGNKRPVRVQYGDQRDWDDPNWCNQG